MREEELRISRTVARRTFAFGLAALRVVAVEVHHHGVLLAVLRFAVVAAHNHRLAAQAVRHGVHLHQIDLARCGALVRYLRQLGVHLNGCQLVLGCLPELLEIRLLVRSGNYPERVDGEVEVSCRLAIDEATGAIYARLQIVGGAEHEILRTVAGYGHAVLDGRHLFLRVGANLDDGLQLDGCLVRVLDADRYLRLATPNPVVVHRHGLLDERQVRFLRRLRLGFRCGCGAFAAATRHQSRCQ